MDVVPEYGMEEFVPWFRIFLFKAKGCLMTAGNFHKPFHGSGSVPKSLKVKLSIFLCAE